MMPLFVRYLLGYPMLQVKRQALRHFRRELAHAKTVQAHRLKAHLAQMTGSRFAKEHKLERLRTPADLALALPVAGYERMEPYIKDVMQGDAAALFAPGTKILMFAKTSGTTAAAKYIPVTDFSLQEYRRSWAIWGVALAEQHPLLPYHGIINLASPWRSELTPSGVPCGSVTGLLHAAMHKTLRVTNTVPPFVAGLSDGDTRLAVALRLAIARPDVMMITTANPSTLLQFAQYLRRDGERLLKALHYGDLGYDLPLSPEQHAELATYLRADPRLASAVAARAAAAGGLTPAAAWPKLAVLGVWTGGTLTPYLNELPSVYGPVAWRDHGLSASEGRMSLPLADGQTSGPLNIDGAFYEFIPEADYLSMPLSSVKTVTAEGLTPGCRYYLVVTTSGGLVRYDMGDVVECTGFQDATPLVRFLNKGRDVASLTGEKLTAFQVGAALRSCQSRLNLDLGDCVLAPEFGSPAGYHLLVDGPLLEGAPRQRLAAVLDDALAEHNSEYADKRRSGRLAPLVVDEAAVGALATLKGLKMAAGGPSEQYKHRFLVPDLDFVAKYRRAPSTKE